MKNVKTAITKGRTIFHLALNFQQIIKLIMAAAIVVRISKFSIWYFGVPIQIQIKIANHWELQVIRHC